MIDLTDREREVATLLRAGLTQREVAVELGISPHTVKVYVASIKRKTGSRTVAQAISRTAA